MKQWKQLIQIFIAMVLVLTPLQTLAVSSATRKAIEYNAAFYDSRERCDSQATALPTNLQGNDNIEKAFRYFTAKGLSAEQAAAIIGNLQAESGVNPQSHQNGGGPGRGIAQWSVDERWIPLLAFAKSQNKSEWDLGLQLDFMWQEFHGSEKSAFEKFMQETRLVDMTVTFTRLYERAGTENNPVRLRFAQQALKLYGGSAAAPVTQAGSVYMIGDSLTQGIEQAGVAGSLEQKGWTPTTINASPGRSITGGGLSGDNKKPAIDAIADDQAKIKDAKAIYVGLGTNPGGTINQTTWGADIDRFIDKLRGYNSDAPIYWLNVFSPAIPDRDARNKTLSEHATTKKFTVIDASELSNGAFDAAKIHPASYNVLKDLVANALMGANAQTQADANKSCSDTTAGNGQDSQYIDGFTVYDQYDPDWRDKPFGSSTIGPSGCGPSAMAMIVTALTGKPVTPPEVATVAKSMYVPGSGSSWNIGPFVAAHYGLKSTPVEANVAKISEVLVKGGLVVAPGQGAVPYTDGGHFIVIRAVTADGKWRIGDSGHRDTSNKNWDPAKLVTQMRDGGVYAITK